MTNAPYCFVLKGWSGNKIHRTNHLGLPKCGVQVDKTALEYANEQDHGGHDPCLRCFPEGEDEMFRPPDGHEAEELRAGIEKLMAEAEADVPVSDLQDLLDRVDARDSLAYLERPERLEARLRELRITRTGPDLFRCEECNEHWRSNTGDKEDEEHRDGCIFKTP